MYVIDTHALIWYLTDDDKLGAEAKNILERIDREGDIGVIPTIVIIEALAIFEKKGLCNLFSDIYGEIKRSSNYLLYPLSVEIIDEMLKLSPKLELHDRVILATAKYLNSKLITKDRIIRNYYPDTVW